jgi:hypothetical protein
VQKQSGMSRSVAVTLELTDEQAAAIEAILGSLSDELMTGLAQAALTEYALAFGGERVPAGVRDLRELRLRLLAQRLPEGLPTERQVASLCRLTSTQARTLIAGTRARYPRELTVALGEAAKEALTGADKAGDTIRMTLHPSLAAYLRDLLQDSAAPPPVRRPDSTIRYDVDRQTVEELCSLLGLRTEDIKALR